MLKFTRQEYSHALESYEKCKIITMLQVCIHYTIDSLPLNCTNTAYIIMHGTKHGKFYTRLPL